MNDDLSKYCLKSFLIPDGSSKKIIFCSFVHLFFSIDEFNKQMIYISCFDLILFLTFAILTFIIYLKYSYY